MRTLPAGRFLVLSLGICALGLVGVAAVNAVVDPYDLFHWVSVPALTTRPLVEGHDRMHQAHLITRNKPDMLVLGTSRAQVMVDPADSAFAQFAAARGWPAPVVVNAAVNGAQPYDMLRMFQHAEATAPVRLLVMGLDLLAFDAGGRTNPEHKEERLAVDAAGGRQPLAALADVPAALLSEDALRASVATVRQQALPSYLLSTGQRDPRYQERARATAGSTHAYFVDSEKSYLEGYACSDPFALRRAADKGGKAPHAFDDFVRILDVARAQHTVVRLYFSPLHIRHLAAIDAAGLSRAHTRFKEHVAELVLGARAAGLDVELLDFAHADDPVMAEAPTDAPPPPNWWESSHATAALGHRVLAELLLGSQAAETPLGRPVEVKAAVPRSPSIPLEIKEEIAELAADIVPETRRIQGCQ